MNCNLIAVQLSGPVEMGMWQCNSWDTPLEVEGKESRMEIVILDSEVGLQISFCILPVVCSTSYVVLHCRI